MNVMCSYGPRESNKKKAFSETHSPLLNIGVPEYNGAGMDSCTNTRILDGLLRDRYNFSGVSACPPRAKKKKEKEKEKEKEK